MSDKSVEEKLLPCPFCGSTGFAPKIEALAKWSDWQWRVACYGCLAQVPADTKEQAIKAWNTRAQPKEGCGRALE